MDENNVLQSVKKLLGSDEYFNPDLLIAINAAFSTMAQLGVGPRESIFVDENTTWTALTTNLMVISLAKQYTVLKTRLYFDSSTASSYLIEQWNKECNELEWRMNVAVDSENTF